MVQQLHLFRRRIDLDAVHHQLVGIEIYYQLVEGQLLLRGAVVVAAAHDGVDAGDKLLDVKGFGHVIVGTHVKTGYLIRGLSLSGEHDDRHGGKLPDLLACAEPVELRYHEVEQDHGVLAAARHVHGGLAVIAHVHLIALVFEVEFDALDDGFFVVHNQYFHRGPSVCVFSRK